MLNTKQESLAIGANIRLALSGLSTKEKLIAEWFLTKGNIDKTTSIKYVSDALEVSDALVVKLAKKLGFSGYRALRASLVEYTESLPFNSEIDIKISKTDNVDMILNKVFTNTLSALQEAHAVVNHNDIEKAAKLLHKANRVVILGVGGSATVGQDFEKKLLRIGIHSNTYSDLHLMIMAVCHLSKHDVVIIVSQSGASSEIVKAAQVAKEADAKIICITNNHKSLLTEYSDIAIFSPIKGGVLLGNNATARIVQLNLLDVLYIATIQQNYTLANARLNKAQTIINSFN